jgi:membrane-associated phospholipid phosphatase
MGAAGPLAAVTYVFGLVAMIFALIVFLVGGSRIQLKVHNFTQVIAGILFAFISTYLQIYIIVSFFK